MLNFVLLLRIHFGFISCIRALLRGKMKCKNILILPSHDWKNE